jgi:hypothetical protein
MAELIMQSFGGRANETIEQTQKRLLKDGSWKKQRIVVLLPASNNMSTKVALSHWNLMFPPNQAVVKIIALGMEVGAAYSEAIDGVLAHPELSKWEYILTLEHDNMPPPDGVLKLIKEMEEHPEFDCIGGLYYTKGDLGVAQIWGDPKDPLLNFRPLPPDLNGGMVECCGTGMGFNLWRMKMFKDKEISRPLFKTLTGIEGQGIGTQDLQFWSNARKLGYRCAIDCSVKVGHYDAENDITY